ncbi:MAG: site-specific DNA-methyltransferase [Muribaculaceae bacterium]
MRNSETIHNIYPGLSQKMDSIENNSVELVVTSPPYPMIEMWDDIMSTQNPNIRNAINANNGNLAFELMHKELDKVWNEVFRVLIPGGIACINIGDATRTINGNFSLYSNHSRIINYFINNGFVNLPNILWRKQTNAPNKFMGSGMLPAGAYVTLEHEWILIFRKGGKREFKNVEDKLNRRKSSFFWEERNMWFSDMWDNIKGTKQKIIKSESRERSAAFPLEIPYRLINMFSLQGDSVLDPFLGTGTTTIAAMMSNRNSIGYEIDSHFVDIATENIWSSSITQINEFIAKRIESHKEFIANRLQTKEIKHYNETLGLPVITSQEINMQLSYLNKIVFLNDNTFSATYQGTLPLEQKDIIFLNKTKSKITPTTQIALPF